MGAKIEPSEANASETGMTKRAEAVSLDKA